MRLATSKGRKRACGDNPMMNAASEEGSDDGKEMMVSLRAAPGAAGGSEKRENFNNYAEFLLTSVGYCVGVSPSHCAPLTRLIDTYD